MQDAQLFTVLSSFGVGGVVLLWLFREYQKLRQESIEREAQYRADVAKIHSDYATRLEALHERHTVDLRAHEERAVMVAERAHSVLDRVAHAIARARSNDDGPDPTNHPTPPSRPAGFGG